jgi:hypothetical protein
VEEPLEKLPRRWLFTQLLTSKNPNKKRRRTLNDRGGGGAARKTAATLALHSTFDLQKSHQKNDRSLTIAAVEERLKN